MLIDEPSIGLSPLMVQEVFAILKDLRDARRHDPADRAERPRALAISDYGLVLEQGQTRIEDTRGQRSSPTRASPSCSCGGGDLRA